MRILRLLAVFSALVIFLGCAGPVPDKNINVSEGVNPWTHLNWNNNPDNFQFAVVGDRAGNMVPGIFKRAVDKLNLLQPEFVLSVGDLIDGGKDNTIEELKAMHDEFDSMVNELNMPFFYTVGNHDITNEGMNRLWKEKHGKPYYHFTYKDVLFLVLCTEDLDYPEAGRTRISDKQVEYFRDILEKNKDSRWTFVFMHKPQWKPIYKGEPVKNWDVIESLLAGRSYTVIAGHQHEFSKTERNEMRYY
ncbi:metallophosphoesterase family protein, partial [candidate division KSB1 bacterium]